LRLFFVPVLDPLNKVTVIPRDRDYILGIAREKGKETMKKWGRHKMAVNINFSLRE
jgi:hypothetical protein